jgi:HD-like signal output (HDOD) protein
VTHPIEVEFSGVADANLLAEIMAALGDESIGFQVIAELVSRDTVLATEVLRVANSRYYGLAGAVQSLQFACAVVGSLGLRSIALAELGRRGGRYPEELNVISQATALKASVLAQEAGLDPQVATAAGLVLHLGRILIAQQDPVGFAEIERLPVRDRAGYERERYGEIWLEITLRALRHWSFPAEFVVAVGQSPDDPLGVVLCEVVHQLEDSESDEVR